MSLIATTNSVAAEFNMLNNFDLRSVVPLSCSGAQYSKLSKWLCINVGEGRVKVAQRLHNAEPAGRNNKSTTQTDHIRYHCETEKLLTQ